MDMDLNWEKVFLFVVAILIMLCWFCICLARCLARCLKCCDKEEARVHNNPELIPVAVPALVAGLPPGHYVYVINSDTNSEVPPPPYPGT